MTQHLVIDILSTGNAKECGILKIAAVSFDPMEDIEEGRNYFASSVSVDSLKRKGYLFSSTCFNEFTVEANDYKVLEYINEVKDTIATTIQDFTRYLLEIATQAKESDIKVYITNLYKIEILRYTLTKEGYTCPKCLESVTQFTDIYELNSLHKFDVLDRANTLAALVYGHLVSETIKEVWSQEPLNAVISSGE